MTVTLTKPQRRMSLEDSTYLLRLLGPETFTELMQPSPEFIAAIDALGARVARMSDEQIRAQFHVGDEMVGLLRQLSDTCAKSA